MLLLGKRLQKKKTKLQYLFMYQSLDVSPLISNGRIRVRITQESNDQSVKETASFVFVISNDFDLEASLLFN